MPGGRSTDGLGPAPLLDSAAPFGHHLRVDVLAAVLVRGDQFEAQFAKISPNHKGANEYLGELYLMMKNLPKAEEQLAKLKSICPAGCEELEDLEADIADYKAGRPG